MYTSVRTKNHWFTPMLRSCVCVRAPVCVSSVLSVFGLGPMTSADVGDNSVKALIVVVQFLFKGKKL